MRQNFSITLKADGKSYMAVMLPQMRHNGLHYEVNIKGLPRFEMRMSALGRYDITDSTIKIPYALVLAASDAIEQYERKV